MPPNSSSTQLQALIDRLNAGDSSARNDLISHAVERLRKLTRKMLRQDFARLRRWEETDDILNESVIRLIAALKAVPPVTTKEFFQLATRHIRWELLDLARRCRAPEFLSAHQASGANGSSDRRSRRRAATTSSDPRRLAAWTEFHSAVAALPEDERDVFDLLWYQDCRQADAAAILKVSVPTIKRLWVSARLQLGDSAKALLRK
jgi:RNA polymerase sigma-70 factor (ECF subfamily)